MEDDIRSYGEAFFLTSTVAALCVRTVSPLSLSDRGRITRPRRPPLFASGDIVYAHSWNEGPRWAGPQRRASLQEQHSISSIPRPARISAVQLFRDGKLWCVRRFQCAPRSRPIQHNLHDPPRVANPEWSPSVTQPDAGLPADGLYTATAPPTLVHSSWPS